MRKRIIIPFLVLSFFLSVFVSCGIPNIFTFNEANDVLDISNNGERLRFSKDSGVFTGHLMFLYLLTDETDNISFIQSSLVSSFKSSNIINSYNSKNIKNYGEEPVVSISRTISDQTKEFKLFQLHINDRVDGNFNNNGQNWASNYMFTLAEGDYSIDYEFDENRNLVISIFDYYAQDTDPALARAITIRCNDLPFEFNETKNDYTADNPSNMTLYMLPAIVVNSPEYNNKLLYCSSSFATVPFRS